MDMQRTANSNNLNEMFSNFIQSFVLMATSGLTTKNRIVGWQYYLKVILRQLTLLKRFCSVSIAYNTSDDHAKLD